MSFFEVILGAASVFPVFIQNWPVFSQSYCVSPIAWFTGLLLTDFSTVSVDNILKPDDEIA